MDNSLTFSTSLLGGEFDLLCKPVLWNENIAFVDYKICFAGSAVSFKKKEEPFVVFH